MKKYALILAATAAIAGCKVGPDYVAPQFKFSDKYENAPAASAQPSTQPVAELARWWDVFNDATLTSLVNQAMEQNLDLKIAATRIRQAKAARGIAESALWPNVNLDGSATRSKSSANVQSMIPGYKPEEQAMYTVRGSAGWELDFFGGNARNLEASLADIDVARETQWSIRVALAAEVALNYIELRGNQRQLAITKKNIKAQRDTLELTQTRFAAGLNNELNVARSRALVASSEASVPPLEQSIMRNIHMLSVLMGMPPETLTKELIAPTDLPAPIAEPPVGMPSELLQRRPDIRAAERQVAAATARVGVATAELYPKFTISGQLGTQSKDYKHLGDIQSGFWSFGPGFSWPVFDAGRIKSQIAVANANVDITLATYEKTILGALMEVEDSLVALEKTKEQIDALTRAVEANRRAVELSSEIYNTGLQDFQWVLDAQKNLFNAEEALSAVQTLQSINVIALYKALGGGWEDCGCSGGMAPE